MNHINIFGRVMQDAEVVLVKASGGETPLVTFFMLDAGLPYQKSSPMVVEIHFMKEAAMHIYSYLKRGKEVYVDGFLKNKEFTTTKGENRSKFYISAEYVLFPGEPPKKGVTNDNNCSFGNKC